MKTKQLLHLCEPVRFWIRVTGTAYPSSLSHSYTPHNPLTLKPHFVLNSIVHSQSCLQTCPISTVKMTCDGSPANLLWEVKSEGISSSTCFPKYDPFVVWNVLIQYGSSAGTNPWNSNPSTIYSPLTAFFHFLLISISLFLFFSLLPLSPSKFTDLFLWESVFSFLHPGNSFLVLKKKAAQSWHSSVTSAPSFNQKNFQEHQN